MTQVEASTSSALDTARSLAAAGIPIFCAYPDPSGSTPSGAAVGFMLPKGWQTTSASPRYVDAWSPGMALCMVTGCGLDVIDVDPRNGGDLHALDGMVPSIYGVVFTPSGGTHYYVASLGVRSMNDFAPGIDIKAGDSSGTGRGYAFLPPTSRVSKVDGVVREYSWVS